MAAEQRVVEPPEKSAIARRDDYALWAAILVPLHAAGINTIVGYIVAHHACNVNKKGALLSVSIIDLLLTLASGALAWMLRVRFMRADDAQPVDGRRLFMAHLGLLLALLCTLIIVSGLLASVIVSPCD
jgi:NhaP-type Na+/H+ or K+/H+ antiporter